MAIESLTDLSGAQKEELVASLSSIIVASVESEDTISSDKLQAVATASGNSLSGLWAALFASVVDKAGGVDKFCAAPGSGGGGGGGGGDGGDAAAEEAVEEEKEEEEEMDLGGGMDMFGGEEAGDGNY
mmetsp:Transcript_37642/g.55445  ORF Transcript_37642/g.55445 Transcript_37642/m.55445 type:complete len:128 (-) Transcript_37642:42-425(-)|eukprot:CAMPEP_0195516608 /NCGR_PEP_ID=MMETSP0794_2-20130614/7994_1 /TAXON_ID=515487 /ORGANISM="Stephanopyxis turris, Strain CCMP 815" /LENGTH=127 /DNA_ID=CAMNT_0040645255 /DNA_START=87 /DNA_END=470 /DNA_ORIENTATION=+